MPDATANACAVVNTSWCVATNLFTTKDTTVTHVKTGADFSFASLAGLVCGLLGLQRLPRGGAFHGAGTGLLLFQACGGSLGLGHLRGWRHAAEYTSG